MDPPTTDPPTEDPVDPPTTDPPTEDPTDTPTEDPTQSPSPGPTESPVDECTDAADGTDTGGEPCESDGSTAEGDPARETEAVQVEVDGDG